MQREIVLFSAAYTLSRTEVEALLVAQELREIVELRYELFVVGRGLERGQPVGGFDIVKRSIGTIEIVTLILDEHAGVGQQTDEVVKDNAGVGVQRGEVVRLGLMAGGRGGNRLVVFLLLRSESNVVLVFESVVHFNELLLLVRVLNSDRLQEIPIVRRRAKIEDVRIVGGDHVRIDRILHEICNERTAGSLDQAQCRSDRFTQIRSSG